MRQTEQMHARSAVVDLYGDHLSRRGWWAPVSTVVALAAAVAVRPPATRTAISRLVAQGWLEPERRVGGHRGYAASERARDRWARAHARVYAPGPAPWDGRWHVVHVDSGGDRRRRDHVVATLSYLGYGRLGGGGWISPRRSPELSGSLDRLGAGWVAVHGPLDEGAPETLTARVWDLDALGRAYADFLHKVDLVGAGVDLTPDAAYARRTRLVHEWRRFLFLDPGLPREVLPADWPGDPARRRFLDLAETLAPAAGEFVDGALRVAGPKD